MKLVDLARSSTYWLAANNDRSFLVPGRRYRYRLRSIDYETSIPFFTFQKALAYAQRIEALGFDDVIRDHLTEDEAAMIRSEEWEINQKLKR